MIRKRVFLTHNLEFVVIYQIFVFSITFFLMSHKTFSRPQKYPVIYVVANPVAVRGLQDSKISEEHLQSSNESTNK